jgi:hypothetical protein
MRRSLALLFALAGCVDSGRSGGGPPDAAFFSPDFAHTNGGGQQGCGELQGCYTVYAHGDHVLYLLDLPNKLLKTVGPFHAPTVTDKKGNVGEDVITDLAVASDNTIYVISETNLYTADPNDGHVTLVGPVTACGTYAVALTFVPDGSLYAADYLGAFCKIDLSVRPPAVHQVATLGSGMAIAGDIVAVADGTMFGTAYNVNQTATQSDNLLVKIDPASGMVTKQIGAIGYGKLFGVAFSEGKVFGFTHDGSGDVVTIDPRTGLGTHYGTFEDPASGMPIRFAGAGVNSMVAPPPIM